MRKTVVVAGAGPAGLTAAHELLRVTDAEVIVLEAARHIGGISRTHVHNGMRMDIGGHRFFSKSGRVMDFWLGLFPLQGAPAADDEAMGRGRNLSPGGPDPEKDERVMLLRRRCSRILYLRKFFAYPISLSLATIAALGLPRTLHAGFGYIGARLRRREEKTLEDFMVNRFGKPLYRMFFEDYNMKVWGVSPREMAPDWGAQRIKGLSLWKAVTGLFKSGGGETSLIEEFYYPKLGPGQLWEALAADVVSSGGKVRLGVAVTGVNIADGRVASVTARGPDGEEVIACDSFVSSMPIADLVAAIAPREAVPKGARETAAALPYRDFMTAGLLVDKLALKNKTRMRAVGSLVPDCWIYVQERDVKIGRLQIFNNWSPYMAGGAKGVWLGLEYFCREGDGMWQTPDGEFIKMAAAELEKIGVTAPGTAVRDAVVLRVPKAYPGYFGAYERFPALRGYLDTIGNLYCIGRNGQHRYNNMDHSMLTGFEAARLIASGLTSATDKAALWSINAEEEYHETAK
ncbi:MAG: NAD(P)/FAD-dependent oxidoreductase [Oscillospiraceae bacterium]|jgi:protoporphyrinogen oxidase|nr:NAD(P)/FAD-dependent oxidoreductase [Oscillospiraceae bacterium]